VKVYRVAHKSALESGFPSGPYAGKGVPDDSAQRLWGMASAHSTMTHPTPYADPDLHHIAEHERCGFDSLDALNAWFDGWTDALAECEFVVWTYEVPEWALRVGRCGQVVFDSIEAVEVSSHEFMHEQTALFA